MNDLRLSSAPKQRTSPAKRVAEHQLIVDKLRAGWNPREIAQFLSKRSEVWVQWYVTQHQLVDVRRGRVYSTSEVAALFGINQQRVYYWIRQGWLAMRCTPGKQRRVARIMARAIRAFIEYRPAWPVWNPSDITDPTWQAIAITVRAQAGGQWRNTTELAERFCVVQGCVEDWMRLRRWDVEYIKVGYHWYVWEVNDTPLTLPPDMRGRRLKGNSRAQST